VSSDLRDLKSLKVNSKVSHLPRIIILTPNPPSFHGGVERFVFYLIQILKYGGFSVSVIDNSMLGKLHTTLVNSIKKISYTTYETLLSYLISKSVRIMNKNTQTIIISNNCYGWSLNKSFVRAINVYHGTAVGYRKAMEDAGYHYYHSLRVNELLEKRSALGKIIVAVSNNTKRELESYYKLTVHSVIENGVDVHLFRPLRDKERLRKIFGLPQSKFLGLFVGRNTVRKGVDILSAISTQLPADVYIVALSNRSVIGKNILNLRNIDFHDLPKLYSAVDFFLFPSRYEGCSYSVIEAMACGLPLVVSNIGHVSRIKREDSYLSEFIIDDFNPLKYVENIVLLKDNENVREELGIRARESVLKHNTLEIFGEQYLKLLHKFMD